MSMNTGYVVIHTECCYIQHHDEAETETAAETLCVHVVRLFHVLLFPHAGWFF